MAAATPASDTPTIASLTATRSVVAAPLGSTPQPVKLEFPLAGYRINTYDAASNGISVFRMSLPVPGKSSWFSVVVYCSDAIETKSSVQSHKNFRGRSDETLLFERTLSPAEYQVEYTVRGTKPEEKSHVYVREIFANDKAYKISGVMPDTDWPTAGAKLKAYVDSFEPAPDPAPGKVAFPRQAYRISLLDGAFPANAQGMLLAFGPDAPTVSVEPYAKTLQDYRAERKPPMMIDSKHKFTILAEKTPTENALVTEYAEEIPADKSHPQTGQVLTYEKVFLANGQLYRAWGSLMNQADRKSSTQIKACVESLEAMPAPASAPASAPAPAK